MKHLLVYIALFFGCTVSLFGKVILPTVFSDNKDTLFVGRRLANYALAEVYHQNPGEYKSPIFQSVRFEKNKAYLRFNNASGLKSAVLF